jgi:hypothetical protein
MKTSFEFDYSLKNKKTPTLIDLHIIPRVGDAVDLNVFLSDDEIEELESGDYDDNSGADYAIVSSVTLRKDKEANLYYSIYLIDESDFER